MSINSAMLAGVSGLVANSSALAAISDNIANVNTVAYKRNQVNFANVVTAQAAAGRYSAGGVQGVARQYVSQQGLVQTATSSTDLAIAGEGFFVVSDKGQNLAAGDARKFTRAGSFSVDADGYLKNNAGLYLLGWDIPSNGTPDINPSDLGSLTPINVKGLGAAVSKTSEVIVSANLDKTQTASTGAATYASGTVQSMADYADDPTTGTKPDFTLEMNVIDSTGGSHKVVMAFLKPADAPGPPIVPAPANTWNAEIYAVPASDVDDIGRPGQLATGLVVFNPDGSLDLTNSTLTGLSGTEPKLTLDLGASPPATTTAPNWAQAQGIEGQSISIDLEKLTQYASTSTVNSVNSDGASVGNVVGVRVDEEGVVSALYDNSEVRKIAQLGLAIFPNADGLEQISGNAYRPTVGSGELVLKVPGVGGAGRISPSSLEASTVDLSSEFTGLITTQKAYSASSKIITTADQMLDELINIIR
jgi:flagellar hook protein FlgE